jgi:hypothetical protein
MLSSSLTHSITKAYHIMPHNQTQYYHTLLISIPLKATGNDPSYTMHQLSYLAQPKQPKLHNNSPGKTTSLPIRVLPMPIRVLPTPDQIHTRIAHVHTRMLRVSHSHTRTNRDQNTFKTSSSSSIRVLPSAIRVPCHLIRVLPSAIRVWPETRLPDLLWLSLLRDLSFSTFHSPIFHNNCSYHLTRIIPYSISPILTLLHLIPTNSSQS